MSWPSPSVAIASLEACWLQGLLSIPSALPQVLLVTTRLSALTGVGRRCSLPWAHCYPVIFHPSLSLYLHIHTMRWIIHGGGASLILIGKTYDFSCICFALPQVPCPPLHCTPFPRTTQKCRLRWSELPSTHFFLFRFPFWNSVLLLQESVCKDRNQTCCSSHKPHPSIRVAVPQTRCPPVWGKSPSPGTERKIWDGSVKWALLVQVRVKKNIWVRVSFCWVSASVGIRRLEKCAHASGLSCVMLFTTDTDHLTGFRPVEFWNVYHLVSMLGSLLYQNFPDNNKMTRAFLLGLLEVVSDCTTHP